MFFLCLVRVTDIPTALYEFLITSLSNELLVDRLLILCFDIPIHFTFTGLLSVLVRQTNIIWMGMALGTTFIDKLISQTLPFIKGHEKSASSNIAYTFTVSQKCDLLILLLLFVDNNLQSKFCVAFFSFRQDISQVIGFYFRRIYLIPKQIRLLCVYLSGYIIVIILFGIFIYVNGSIVVGDKTAHEAAVHLPQV